MAESRSDKKLTSCGFDEREMFLIIVLHDASSCGVATQPELAGPPCVNLVAIVGWFHRNLLALQRSGVSGDDLINHPVSLTLLSKLDCLCRVNHSREMAALRAVNQMVDGESVEYEVIPLWHPLVGRETFSPRPTPFHPHRRHSDCGTLHTARQE